VAQLNAASWTTAKMAELVTEGAGLISGIEITDMTTNPTRRVFIAAAAGLVLPTAVAADRPPRNSPYTSSRPR
jgi:hypothetical protein